MASLKEKSKSILSEKQLNLLPENIKKDITIFGVTGTYEGSAGVKLFETIEDMNNDETAKEGDLAIVYRNEIQDMKVDTQTQYITFPETVTLPEVFTSSLYLRLRAIDASIMFDGNIQLDQTSFRFDGFSESGMIRVSYSSDDGITYTRDEFMNESGSLSNPVDLGTLVQVEAEMEEWNDSFGYFMQIDRNIFEGLFNYKLGVFSYAACLLSELTVLDNKLQRGTTYILTNKDEIDRAISNAISYMQSEMNMEFSGGDAGTVLMKDTDTLVFIFGADSTIPSSGRRLELTIDTNTNTVTGLCTIDSYNGCMLVEFDIHTGSYITHTFDTLETTLSGNKATSKYNQYYLLSYYNSDSKKLQPDMYCMTGSSVGNRYGNVYEYESLKYVLADTQLSASSENIYNAIAYGKTGAVDGNIAKNISNLFEDTNAEIYLKLKNYYDNLNIQVSNDQKFDKALFIPTKSNGDCVLNFNNVTSAVEMFKGNHNIINLGKLNTANLIDMTSMFHDCWNLASIPKMDLSHIDNVTMAFYNNFCITDLTDDDIDLSNATTLVSCFSVDTALSTVNLTLPNAEDISGMFQFSRKLHTVNLNTSNKLKNIYCLFDSCDKITNVTISDTSGVTNFEVMFGNCSALENPGVIDMTSATNIGMIFSSCPKLTDEGLNNIMASLLTATQYTGTKTLKYIGLSEEQATKCTTLSNYQAFTGAGWVTGY